LQRVDLPEINLRKADLRKANLRGVNLQETNLQGTDLRETDLTEAKNLTQDQVQTACGDEYTKLPTIPEGLTPPPPCPE
jgi:uncharacterized protein YjbI with pentapeptide repeats